MKIFTLFFICLLAVSISAQKDYIVTVHKSEDLESVYKGKFKNKLPIIDGYTATLTDSEVNSLRVDKRVKYVEPVVNVYTQETQIQYPTYYWNLDRIDDRPFIYPATNTYRYNQTGQGVDIYIVDTGIFKNDPEFEGRAVKGYGSQVQLGCNTHGNIVASIAGGRIHGVAKKVRLIDVRVFPCNDVATADSVVKGLDWVLRSVKRSKRPAVLNLSLGTNGIRSFAIEDALRKIYETGALSVVAAGNRGENACDTSPSGYTDTLSVSGVAYGDVAWGFSSSSYCQNCGFNWGSCVDIFAPGFGGGSYPLFDGSGYTPGIMGGTSSASPHGAGVAALYLETHPLASPQEIRNAIVNNGTYGILYQVYQDTPNIMIYSLWE